MVCFERKLDCQIFKCVLCQHGVIFKCAVQQHIEVLFEGIFFHPPLPLTMGSIVVLKDKATERIFIEYFNIFQKTRTCYPHMTKSVEPDILDNRIL